MKEKKTLLISVVATLSILSNVTAFSQVNEVELPDDFSKHFKDYGVRGSLVIYDLNNDKYFYYDKERTKKRYSPASTFKIFNSLAGLHLASANTEPGRVSV